MPSVVVLSYTDLTEPTTGGTRRMNALLDAVGRETVLVQPRVHHPGYATVPFPRDFGRSKVGVNWGIFNFYWPANRRVARNLIRHHSPALVVLTSMWTEQVVRDLPGVPCVLDMHDVNAVAIGERYGARHPFTRLVRAQEARAARRAAHVFTCSAADRDQFTALYGLEPGTVTVVPNGVDVAACAQAPALRADDPVWRRNLRDATVLFFMGKLDYQPNAAALEFLGGALMPELERRAPGAYRLLVCGGPLPAHPHHPAMVFAGAVPEEALRAYVKAADICLAPLFTGSGTRLKLLEYMAAGRPVVSTPKAAEGLQVTPGAELQIAESDAFAEAIESLGREPERAAALGARGQSFVRKHYDWAEACLPRWREVLSRWPTPAQGNPAAVSPGP